MVLFIFNKFNILMEWKKQWGPFKSFETWKKPCLNSTRLVRYVNSYIVKHENAYIQLSTVYTISNHHLTRITTGNITSYTTSVRTKCFLPFHITISKQLHVTSGQLLWTRSRMPTANLLIALIVMYSKFFSKRIIDDIKIHVYRLAKLLFSKVKGMKEVYSLMSQFLLPICSWH